MLSTTVFLDSRIALPASPIEWVVAHPTVRSTKLPQHRSVGVDIAGMIAGQRDSSAPNRPHKTHQLALPYRGPCKSPLLAV
jgi:hypothetical protein